MDTIFADIARGGSSYRGGANDYSGEMSSVMDRGIRKTLFGLSLNHFSATSIAALPTAATMNGPLGT
jgi:hypothetical protein